MKKSLPDAIAGALIGGAVGDALGAPVEFLSLDEIRIRHGVLGVRDFQPAYGRLGAVTDDTQMTLFTAEGLLRAYVRSNLRGIVSIPSVVCAAYNRWLETQQSNFDARKMATRGWLYHIPELWAVRAPGNTCLSALRAINGKNLEHRADNNSKGAGGIMRVGPVSMMYAQQSESSKEVFDLASRCAWLTHGHPTGFLSAGAFAVILHGLLSGLSIEDGISRARDCLATSPGSQETLTSLDKAVQLAGNALAIDMALKELGEAWIGEEALGVAVFCAMRANSFEDGVRMSVNHSGDSDTTGLLVGQLLGATYGFQAIPSRWLESLELKDVLLQMATDLSQHTSWNLEDRHLVEEIVARYPGG